MKIFVVEDDEFKRRDIQQIVSREFENVELALCTSVSHACRAITSERFDLLVLDMSLPTFDIAELGGGGSPQGQGGLEILRVLKRFQPRLAVIIVTQYPDIEYGGVNIPLEKAAKVLSETMNVRIIDCVLYEYESNVWKQKLLGALNLIGDQS